MQILNVSVANRAANERVGLLSDCHFTFHKIFNKAQLINFSGVLNMSPHRLCATLFNFRPKNINMSGDFDSDKTDLNDDLGLTQFSPEVLEFMLGVVKARNSKAAESPSE